ncbi:gamma-glutamyl-gamma-aminobutyrate hydrolase family protein [Leptotrichia wadei]|uniref:gamma-glutamyl-gamma-aminobutyrate hydrolase family protein n=1 Tax=Leptotrichia wadei TaxID=157687 RepID=UPI0022AC7DE0|nr:gamma-glutamyl-gamma-aminobutyrate hydrolase family protein [Leptotrichia wadei]
MLEPCDFSRGRFRNSYHHQTINQLAPGFSVIAKSTDDVIEAIENISNKTFIIGVQWHPEMMAINDELAQKLFKKFVNEVSLRKKD